MKGYAYKGDHPVLYMFSAVTYWTILERSKFFPLKLAQIQEV